MSLRMAPPVSHYIRTVSLKDWWLAEAAKDSGGSRFGVAGFESGGLPAARVFSSAPISKRYDLFNLRTVDGVSVVLDGPINKERTCESGFSPEVFKHFLIGFPSNWEESAQKCFVRGAGSEVTSCADFNSGKSYESNKKKNQRSATKLKSNPKTGDSKRERSASQGTTPKKARRKLDYTEQKTPTSAGKKKGLDELSQSSAPKTSRSGRPLLPLMEFWRNQLPIYDTDHGISGIKDGTAILKFRRG